MTFRTAVLAIWAVAAGIAPPLAASDPGEGLTVAGTLPCSYSAPRTTQVVDSQVCAIFRDTLRNESRGGVTQIRIGSNGKNEAWAIAESDGLVPILKREFSVSDRNIDFKIWEVFALDFARELRSAAPV